MACAAPLRAYKASHGRLVFFKSTQKEYHQEPYTGLQVPCGYCILCREEQARQTAVRIYHEALSHEQNSFVTLSYTDAHMPEHGSLRYEDLVKFHKRLRKALGGLRHYSVGEYGDKSMRPHYHACIFGHAFMEDAIRIRDEPPLWTSPMLERMWGLGNVAVGALNFETAKYTASYVTKKLRSQQRYVRIDETSGELIAVQQPRAFMSDNLGKDWWINWNQQLRDHDHVIINGTPQKPPKAYDRWLGEIAPKKLQEIKEKRQSKVTPATQEQNRARARSAHVRAKSKSKSL